MSGCQEVEFSKDRRGYGHLCVRVGGKKRTLLAHRLAYALHYGVDPEGMVVCHKCDNPSCVNPEHLFLGTTQDNVRDRVSKGRGAVGDSCARTRIPDAVAASILDDIDGGMRNVAVAKKYGISRHTVGHIKRGRRKDPRCFDPRRPSK